jgi:CRP-like cAMP-binding protein
MIVLRGWAKTTTVRADRKLIVLSVRGRDETIGESGWLGGRPHSVNVQALDRMKVLAIPVARFASFINAHPHAAVVLAEAMVDRWYESDQRMTAQIAATGPGRLATVLIEFADRYGNPAPTGGAISMTLPLNHSELAAMIGLCRESVARIFTTWRRQGIVSTERRWITIRAPSSLREIADQPHPQ